MFCFWLPILQLRFFFISLNYVIIEKITPDLSNVPKIFLDPKFCLDNPVYFNSVLFSETFERCSSPLNCKPSTSAPLSARLDPEDLTNPFFNEETNPFFNEDNQICTKEIFAAKHNRLLQEKVQYNCLCFLYFDVFHILAIPYHL